MAGKPLVGVETDMSPMYAALGVMEGITAAVSTDLYLNDLINYTQDKLRTHFNLEFTAVARGNQKSYQHMFDWGSLDESIPIPLWRIRKVGQGRRRTMTFDFTESRRYVPLPDGLDIGAGSMRRHVFRWKALVMESGTPVSIYPVEAKFLLIPNPERQRGYNLVKRAINYNPGGANSTGQFTAFWAAWFSSTAPNIVEHEIIPDAERMIKQEAEAGLRQVRMGVRSRPKQFVILSRVGEKARKDAYTRMLDREEREYRDVDDYDEEDEY